MYAIKRLQAGSGTWYWVVNFSRRGVHHERRFYDPKHGGEDAALRAAITWRDENSPRRRSSAFSSSASTSAATTAAACPASTS
jgi:hypothetical protein